MIIKDVLFVKEILKKHFAEAGYCLAISVFIPNIEPKMVFVYIITAFILQGVMIMSTIMPEGENLRRAIKWISANLVENPNQPVQALIEEVVFKFDLSPKDAEFLMTFLRKEKSDK